MAVGRPIRIAIVATADRARQAFRQVSQAAEQTADDVTQETGRIGTILKTGVAVGAVAAGAALTAMATDAIAGARESAEIHRVLESQINNMGAAAKTAFGSATKFAEDYGKQIGRDDDDILKVINKLSTFPAAFGKGTLGAEGMRRATKAAFDLEAAGVGTAEGNIIGLGKALDNPIKGLTALSKSGVSFTEQQKEQITNYVEQGKLAEAQKVLLKGIETNAKGAAKQQADGLDRAKVALDGFAEGIATAALPYLDKFGNWFADKGIPAIERTVDAIGSFIGGFRGTSDEVNRFTEAGDKVRATFDGVVAVLKNPAFQAFAGAIAAIVISMKIYSTTLAVIRTATAAYAAVQAALNVVLAANPIGLIILAIIALVAAIVILWKRSETFRKIVTGAFDAVWGAIKAVWGWVKKNWPLLLAILTGPIGLAVRFVVKNFDRSKEKARDIKDKVKGIFKNAGSLLKGAGKNIVQGLWDGISSLAGWLKDKILGFVAATIPGPVRDALGIGSPSKVMADLARWVPEGVAVGITKNARVAEAAARRLATSTTRAFDGSVSRTTLATDGRLEISRDAGRASSGAPVQITFAPDSGSASELDRALWAWFKRNVKVKGGGSVQFATGV